jgi:hypothetical protein
LFYTINRIEAKRPFVHGKWKDPKPSLFARNKDNYFFYVEEPKRLRKKYVLAPFFRSLFGSTRR